MRRRSCEFYRPLISASLDGDLDVSEQRELEQHLATCEHCRHVLEQYRDIQLDLRTLPPVPVPPPDLARSVRRETIEKPPPPRLVRWFDSLTPRWGLSTAAALALLLIVSALLLVRGYDAKLTPVVADSAPAAQQVWPIYQPIRIEFNKAMNRTSVESNLSIWPPGERDRLPTSWEDDTLVIGRDATQSVPLQPDTSYLIVVSANAQDSYGNRLGENWTLAFRTGPTSTSAQAPEATLVPTETQPPQAPSPTPETAAQPSAAATTPNAAGGGVPTATPGRATTPPPATVGTIGTAVPSATVRTTAPTATAAPTQVPRTEPSPTPTPPPAVAVIESTPTPKPETTPEPSPSAVSTPAASATSPTVEPTPAKATVTPSPTSTVIPVAGAFGSVYWANADVQATLGKPTGPEYVVNAAELGFQHGTMYERFDIGRIYTLYAGGTWSATADAWTSNESAGGGLAPDGKLFIPKRGFGKVWNSDPAIKKELGYALQADEHFLEGRVQEFANGLMLYSDQGFVYVLYLDGTWKLYPDTSGRGTLLDPTSEPSPSPAVTPTVTPAPSPAPAVESPTATPSATPTDGTSAVPVTPDPNDGATPTPTSTP